jgi:glutathione S-transferase
LAGADWLAAGSYTIADIALYAYTHTAAEGGFDLGPYPGIRRWLDRVRSELGHISQMQEEAGVPVTKWPG